VKRGLPSLALVMAALVLSLGAQSKEPLALLRAGEYDAAIAGFRREAQAKPAQLEPQRALSAALREIGRYAEAEDAARAFLAAHPQSPELLNTLGELLVERGRPAEAEGFFQKAIAGRARDALRAEANLGALRWRRGDKQAAKQSFERLIEAYNGSAKLGASDLVAVGIACLHLGEEEPQVYKDALKAFDEAAAADPQDPEPKLWAGELFLAKYNGSDARAAFQEVLAKNPKSPRALLGMARALDFDGERGVPDLLKKSLAVNPNFAEALAVHAEVLTALEDYDGAAAQAQKALEVNPASLEALTALAAARYLRRDAAGFEEATQRALELNPRYADHFSSLAEACVRNRLYREADGFARKAVATDPASWRAHGVLGLNRLRLGRIEEGRQSLETSFKGDPYNVWIKNTLDLLDTFPKYKETQSANFRFFVHAKESAMLTPYLSDIGEEALASLQARYRHRAQTPIRVEVYPSHADFSVRTVGLAGLGALGVCFGSVVAIDSPTAREVGKFNWGSTLWHELAHTIVLELTDFRVPRWVTEGLSVYEERRARPGWGDDLSLEFLMAMKAKKLLPLKDLNNGFVRPDSPEQVALSYYQASLVMEAVEKEHGFDAILGLLRAYKEGRSTPEAFEQVLKTSVENWDARFRAELEARLQKTLAAIRLPEKGRPTSRTELESRAANEDDFLAHATLGRILFEEGKRDQAEKHLERARALFPESGGEETPYYALAMIRKERGDKKQAAELLSRLVALNESHYQANLELAGLLESLGDLKGAAAALERAVYIHPFDASLHARRAALAERAGDKQAVMRARRSAVALDPVDRAEALYQLALAHLELGDTASAKREILRALEAAPQFERGQQLLLRIHRGSEVKR
jgi:tetratricopeptide (TPR) repeat protein